MVGTYTGSGDKGLKIFVVKYIKIIRPCLRRQEGEEEGIWISNSSIIEFHKHFQDHLGILLQHLEARGQCGFSDVANGRKHSGHTQNVLRS